MLSIVKGGFVRKPFTLSRCGITYQSAEVQVVLAMIKLKGYILPVALLACFSLRKDFRDF